MEKIKSQDIERLLSLSHGDFTATDICRMAGAGSDRRYYRIDSRNGLLAGTCGDDLPENRAFVYLSGHFAEKGIPVPRVLAHTPGFEAYIQTYAGDESVFDRLAGSRESRHYTPSDRLILENCMRILSRLQHQGAESLDFSRCYPDASLSPRLVLWDLNYFKYCFLKPSGIGFDENKLQDDFDALAAEILRDSDRWDTFMVRDFQSRNVMVDKDNNLTVIDFQGGRRGPGAYDVASFVWQARAAYPQELKDALIEAYISEMLNINPAFDAADFRRRLPCFVLFRVLQTLGAYGFRGWLEHKPHFLKSLPAGADNLLHVCQLSEISSRFPYITRLADKIHSKWGTEAKSIAEKPLRHDIPVKDNSLTVAVTSFSYKKGLPVDNSGNGGGFIFDCRAPHNPGRYEPFKHLTGLDKPVRDFLETDGEIAPLIENVERIVDASVERYLQRGFTNLSVNFGCTGGQHRSVYAADAVARHLNKKYGVRVQLLHREQNIAQTLEPHDVDVIFDSFLRYPQKSYKSDK